MNILPVLDGWTVDLRLRQARQVSYGALGPEIVFVDFESAEGQYLLGHLRDVAASLVLELAQAMERYETAQPNVEMAPTPEPAPETVGEKAKEQVKAAMNAVKAEVLNQQKAPVCPRHNKAMTWVEKYKFWSCRTKDGDKWCDYRPPKGS